MNGQLVAIEQDIKQGDAAAVKANDYLEKVEFNQRKADDFRITSGRFYLAAQDKCQLAGLKWTHQIKAYSTQAARTISGNMRIARSADPQAELDAERARGAERDQKYRDNMEDRHQTDNLMPISQSEGVDFAETVPLRARIEFDPIPFDFSLVATPPIEDPDWGKIVRELESKLAKAETWIAELEKTLGEVELERDRLQERVEELEQKLINLQNARGSLPRRRPTKAPEPIPLRVQRAVELFFELPAAKHLWVKQRMAEPPITTFRSTGPHTEWIQTFWQCSKEEQDAIREQIKITEQRNAA